MNKSLLAKSRTDRLLKNLGITDRLRGGYTKTFSSVRYEADHDGPSEIVVTVDVAVRDTLLDFGLVMKDYSQEVAVDTFEWSITEVDELTVYGGHYILPVYVVEICGVERIMPKDSLFGALRSQCEYAMSLWRDADILDVTILPEFGCIEAARALMFWDNVVSLSSLRLLHPLAEYCLSYDDSIFTEFVAFETDGGAGRYAPFIPNLSVPSFCTWDGELLPYDAVKSLAVHGVEQKKRLYTRSEK